MLMHILSEIQKIFDKRIKKFYKSNEILETVSNIIKKISIDKFYIIRKI